MKAAYGLIGIAMLAANPLATFGQNLLAEQLETVWMPSAKADRNEVRLTRASNGTLSVHQVQIFAGAQRRYTGGLGFYLVDNANGILYTGDTKLSATFPLPLDRSGVKKSQDEQFGNCELLNQSGAGRRRDRKILGYEIERVETAEGKERFIYWIARDLGCFPLKREIWENSELRLRIETKSIQVLPNTATVRIPEGVRVVSPQKFCSLYQESYGVDFVPAKSCEAWERRYQQIKDNLENN